MPIVQNKPPVAGRFRRARALGEGKGAPVEFVIFAPGDNPGDDGAAIFDKEAARACMTAYKQRGVVRLTIDYNHKSIDSGARPEDQKAAGWFTPEVRTDAKGRPWLWATNVNWTEAAKSGIEKKEWLYISPVFAKDDSSRVVSIVNLAITNNPATWGARPLVAASLGGFSRMDPKIVMLYACLAAVVAGGDPKYAPLAAQWLEAMKSAAGEDAAALEAEAAAALAPEAPVVAASYDNPEDGAARAADMSEEEKRAADTADDTAREADATEEEKRAARGLNVDAAVLMFRAQATGAGNAAQTKRAAAIAMAEQGGMLPKGGPIAIWARSCSDADFAAYLDRVKASGVKVRTAAVTLPPAKSPTAGARGAVDTTIDPNLLKVAARQSGADTKTLQARIIANREKAAKEQG